MPARELVQVLRLEAIEVDHLGAGSTDARRHARCREQRQVGLDQLLEGLACHQLETATMASGTSARSDPMPAPGERASESGPRVSTGQQGGAAGAACTHLAAGTVGRVGGRLRRHVVVREGAGHRIAQHDLTCMSCAQVMSRKP